MTCALGLSPDGEPWLHRDGATRPATWGDIAAVEASDRPRWIIPSVARVYPALRAAGVRLDRCHDLGHAETILGHFEGRPVAAPPAADPTPALFTAAGDRAEDPGRTALEQYAAQQDRLLATGHADRLGLLLAADSVGALLAVEMTEDGIPWSADVHERLLADALGDRPPSGARPPRLQQLAEQIAATFGKPVNPDSPAELLGAFAREGIELETTRKWQLARLEHPVVAPLLEYKELSRLHTANGWSWLREWVRDGRFRPEYVPAGVVTGRWATRGGGALQIPRRLRSAVVADPGRLLVVADAAQLEPRILAAMSRDPGMMRAAGADDMYAALAAEAFGGERARAKVGLLGAMYGQVGGGAARPLQVLRARYPQALRLLENAATAGERGGLVRTHLGRTSPPRSERDPTPAQERARGRFTRNFVVQGTAAEWAESLLGILRRSLHAAYGEGGAARIVFYQHDEVMVHCDEHLADAVIGHIEAAAAAATRLLFGDTEVVFGLDARAAKTYAEAH
ncbi:bifunctional 3'-5' exonuclease/DNA polymerase [Cumulibacter manganitolerans]|uniref:bifunctional 3'-5' exonuclease/DNA polymerase n=1 Tax=Cumulibacter manganitolerans TaxID=1884992 RepID=UPI0012972AC8|nr:bifunctional 3'-5' exonuclease/DNA polymerase [Cumulibacter manganitolerans]